MKISIVRLSLVVISLLLSLAFLFVVTTNAQRTKQELEKKKVENVKKVSKENKGLHKGNEQGKHEREKKIEMKVQEKTKNNDSGKHKGNENDQYDMHKGKWKAEIDYPF